jgi:hypothetical protein
MNVCMYACMHIYTCLQRRFSLKSTSIYIYIEREKETVYICLQMHSHSTYSPSRALLSMCVCVCVCVYIYIQREREREREKERARARERVYACSGALVVLILLQEHFYPVAHFMIRQLAIPSAAVCLIFQRRPRRRRPRCAIKILKIQRDHLFFFKVFV